MGGHGGFINMHANDMYTYDIVNPSPYWLWGQGWGVRRRREGSRRNGQAWGRRRAVGSVGLARAFDVAGAVHHPGEQAHELLALGGAQGLEHVLLRA